MMQINHLSSLSLSLSLSPSFSWNNKQFTVSLNNITRLVLSHNKIAILPPEIVELRNLEYLNLFNNHLEVRLYTVSNYSIQGVSDHHYDS